MIKEMSWTKTQIMIIKRRRAKKNNRKVRIKETSWSKTHIIVVKRRVKGDNGRVNCGIVENKPEQEDSDSGSKWN